MFNYISAMGQTFGGCGGSEKKGMIHVETDVRIPQYSAAVCLSVCLLLWYSSHKLAASVKMFSVPDTASTSLKTL